MTVLGVISGPQPWFGLLWWEWAVLGYLMALFWFWLHPRLWVPTDVAAFNADGSQQSLGQTFHEQRLFWRGFATIGPALLATLPIALHCERFWPTCWAVLGLVQLAAGYWLWWFNPHLNLARKLDYVGEYHVSWAANASWLDRTLWGLAWERVYGHMDPVKPGVRDEAVIPIAAQEYKIWLRDCLCGGILLFLFSLFLIWFTL
jgi:hypothetical protein